MTSKFNIVLNKKYYQSPFKNFRVQKNDIMITKVSKNNSNESNNEYYNLESILRNSYYKYELARNLVTRSKNQNIHSGVFV